MKSDPTVKPLKRGPGRPISTARGLLRRALAMLQSGWTKGTWTTIGVRPGRPCYCADGALLIAAGSNPRDVGPVRDHQLYFAAVEAMKEATGADSIITWNDKPERTKREVVDAFKAAIRLAA